MTFRAGWLRPTLAIRAAPLSPYYPIFRGRSFISIRIAHRHYSRSSYVYGGNPWQSRLQASFTNPTETTIKAQTAFSTKAQSQSHPAAENNPIIHDIFEPKTGTWQYIVADKSTLIAIIIDPVLDYDPATQTITTHTADSLLDLIKQRGYTIERILETHAHADHLTAASYLQNRLARIQGHKPLIGLGKRITQVQELFSKRYGIPMPECEGVFDTLFHDDESFTIGESTATTVHLPGHTPDHLGYKIGGKYDLPSHHRIDTLMNISPLTNTERTDNVFCGDSLFNPDIGTARADFPGGSERDLFISGRKLLELPDYVKIWTGHDYPPETREGGPVSWMSVGNHRERNKFLHDGIDEDEFVVMREKRDRELREPRLLHQSLQMNIRGGRLPSPGPGSGENGYRLLHLPLKMGGVEW